MPRDILHDVLQDDLRIVFCGTAASTVSAARGAYYAHPQNKFWRILHQTGLTPALLRPDQFRDLASHRIGLTDLVKTRSGMDHQIAIAEHRMEGRDRLRAAITKHRPKFLAFTSMKAGQTFLGGKRKFGAQPETITETMIWILPSTSGAANGSWQPEIWQAFAKTVRVHPVIPGHSRSE